MLRPLARVFAHSGWSCESEVSPPAALEVLQRCAIDAIVADYQMSPFDGIELCRRARRAGFGGPVVIHTGYASATLRASAARAGAWAVVPKDTSAEALVLQVGTLCDSRARAELPDPVASPCDCSALAAAYSLEHGLSDRQSKLLECALRDESREQAADRIGCSIGTVHGYWRRICAKTGQHGEYQVVLDVLHFALGRTPFPPKR